MTLSQEKKALVDASAATTAPGKILMDCAGAHIGGAKRFLDELDRYLATRMPVHLDLIGRGGYLTPRWLLRRELGLAGQDRSIALNNVAFSRRGRERWVLLRNALHFLTADEARELGDGMSRQVHLQVPVVRWTAARADVLVAPTSAMAERVTRLIPEVTGRIVVRLHPASPRSEAHTPRDATILCPVIFSRYKRMTERLRLIVDAAEIVARAGVPLRVIATATAQDVGDANLCQSPYLRLVGPQSTQEVQALAARAAALLYPTRLESFGYPLAEARVNRQPVVAMDTAQNREVAGDALIGYERETAEELATAMLTAMQTRLPQTPVPELNPIRYFDWLLGVTTK